jgi:Flp pilus assembly protein TadD
MNRTLIVSVGVLALHLIAATGPVSAGDLKIPVPQRSRETPTQKLDRDGVAELKHGHREKAKRLFYKAYLLDPNDPFTLNNLGYIAELEGDADRALRYYALASKDPTDAVIDQSSTKELKGKPLSAAFRQVEDSDRVVSKVSEQAIVLLQQGQVFAARNLLRSLLPRYPDDPFLLNNLGYAMEETGDLNEALRYYSAAASTRSKKPVIVTPRIKWRGKPISEVAAKNAAAVSEQISRGENVEAATARLNLRGVAALNDNNPSAARQFFLEAYHQDSSNAFTLNNLGYIQELQGDWESAQDYYQAARAGRDAKGKVSYSTRPEAEGQKIDSLADDNQHGVESELQTMQAARRRAAHQPVELIRRDSGAPGQLQEKDQPQEKPVPPVGVQPPPLPTLPPPDSDRNAPNPPPNGPDRN